MDRTDRVWRWLLTPAWNGRTRLYHLLNASSVMLWWTAWPASVLMLIVASWNHDGGMVGRCLGGVVACVLALNLLGQITAGLEATELLTAKYKMTEREDRGDE